MREDNTSIIVVSWNTREMTIACLDSLVGKEGVDATSVWVVDNGSSDESAALISSRMPAMHVVINAENRGFAAANNQAMQMADGRYVLLLNSDTLIIDDVVCRSIEYMNENPEVGVMGCRVLNTNGTMQPTCFMEPTFLNLILKCTGLHRRSRPAFLGREHMRSWARDSERDVDVVTGCYMMVRREAIEQVGLMDEDFFFCGEETDWCRRFRKAGWKVRFAPVGEIIHHGNASGRKLEHRRDLLLTAGIVRFHRKHHGLIGGALAWAMLFSFNLSRAVSWRTLSLVKREKAIRERAHHFRLVVSGFSEVWPKAT